MKGKAKVLVIGIWICIVCLAMVAAPVHAQRITVNEKGEIIQQTPDGAINWSRGVISAVGYASQDQEPYAQRTAAAADARANLLMVLGEMSIKRGITVSKARLAQDINIQKIEGMLSGSFLGEPKRQADGTLAVAAYKTISPELYEEILPSKYFTPEPEDIAFEYEEPPKPSASLPPPPPQKPYTGLVLDARGTGVIPSLGFKLMVDGTNEVLYGLSTVNRTKMISAQGMAGYVRSVDAAISHGRVGQNPLVVKAMPASGQGSMDISVSKGDAQAIYAANLENPFLNELKVMVVCGE